MATQNRGIALVKLWVAVVYLVVWNALMLLGLYLNGFQHRIEDPTALSIFSVALLGTGFVSLAVVRSSSVRNLILKPGSDRSDVRRDFGALGALCLLMGVLAVLGVASRLS